MKKGFTILYIINILFGIMIFISYNFIFKGVDTTSVVTFIGLCLLYLSFLILYLKRKKDVCLFDMIVSSIYYVFLIGYFIFSIKYQNKNVDTFSMMYLSNVMYIINIIYLVYGIV